MDVEEFCNAMVSFQTNLSPAALLSELQAIELAMGRKQSQQDGYQARVIDLDLIDHGGAILDESSITLPHPRAWQRRFVLCPLQEINPDFRFPDRAESLSELIDAAPENPLRRTTLLNPLV